MDMKAYIQLLKCSGDALKKIYDQELRERSIPQAINSLEGPFRYSIATERPSATSGFVEQQKYFRRMRTQR